MLRVLNKLAWLFLRRRNATLKQATYLSWSIWKSVKNTAKAQPTHDLQRAECKLGLMGKVLKSVHPAASEPPTQRAITLLFLRYIISLDDACDPYGKYLFPLSLFEFFNSLNTEIENVGTLTLSKSKLRTLLQGWFSSHSSLFIYLLLLFFFSYFSHAVFLCLSTCLCCCCFMCLSFPL